MMPLRPRPGVVEYLEHLLGVIGRSTVETKRNGALSMKSGPTRSHWCMALYSRPECLAGSVACRREQRHQNVADRGGQPVGGGLAEDDAVADVPLQRPVRFPVGQH